MKLWQKFDKRSLWIVQVQPTPQMPPLGFANPTPRQWVDCSSPGYSPDAAARFANPTHGSGWIVQVPTYSPDAAARFRQSHPRQWVDCSSPTYSPDAAARFRQSHPTEVGGLFKSCLLNLAQHGFSKHKDGIPGVGWT
jgi:hypothetical protein